MDDFISTSKLTCNPDVYLEGKPIALMACSSETLMENLVKAVAKNANATVDWYYEGRGPIIKCLGDKDTIARVRSSVNLFRPAFQGRITMLDKKKRR